MKHWVTKVQKTKNISSYDSYTATCLLCSLISFIRLCGTTTLLQPWKLLTISTTHSGCKLELKKNSFFYVALTRSNCFEACAADFRPLHIPLYLLALSAVRPQRMISLMIQTLVVSPGSHHHLGAACKVLAGYTTLSVIMCAQTTLFEQHHSPGAASLAAYSLLPLWMARGKMLSHWRLIRLYCKECPHAVTRLEIKTLHCLHSHTYTGTDLDAHRLGHSC